jgi:hypothetical protein
LPLLQGSASRNPAVLGKGAASAFHPGCYVKLFCRHAPVWHDLDDTGYSTLILLPNKDHDSIEAALPEQAAPVPG